MKTKKRVLVLGAALVVLTTLAGNGCAHPRSSGAEHGIADASGAGEVTTNWAVVRAVRTINGGEGEAQYRLGKERDWEKVTVGTRLQEGATVRTERGTVVDMFLGQNGPVVRLTEKSELEIARLVYRKGASETVIETSLRLRRGRVLGNVRTMSSASHYEVQMPFGVLTMRKGGEFDISASGRVTIISGQGVVVYATLGAPAQIVTVFAGQTAMPPLGQGRRF
jgi:hypothetical protein